MPHTLLLADDSLAIQRVVELTFAGEDVRVVAVGDGQQAIERLLTERPDIVLADIAMPLADGYAVAEFVRSSPAMRHVPVLLLAGAFDVVEESRLGASGARGVLVKPFEPHVVISRVKELLGLAPAGEPAQPADGTRLVTPSPPPRSPRTLNTDPPFWRRSTDESAGDRPAQAETIASAADTSATEAAATASAPPITPTSARTESSTRATAGQPATVPPSAPMDAEAISSALVDRIAARVVEQLGDRLRDELAEVVLNVSERLVREEIQRIHDAARDRQADEQRDVSSS